ncbi:MAG: ribonuclease P protein component [Oscillospiraceae bacterium]|nr:ribonuclease P protein component [Oscillospiraceae bacterium]
MRYRALTRNNEFQRCYTRGKSFVSACLVTYITKNRCGKMRVGITTSKKVGGAVVRNRARRVIRAAMYGVLPQDAGGYDIVFVARAATPKQKSYQVEKVMKKHLMDAGVIKE